MKKKIILIITLSLFLSCSKSDKNPKNITDYSKSSSIQADSTIATENFSDSEESEVIENISNDQIIHNILFQKKVKFIPIFVTSDKFGNKIYGFEPFNIGNEDPNEKLKYREGKFTENNIFMEQDNFFNDVIPQKYSLDIPQGKLTLYKKDINFNYSNNKYELQDEDVLNMRLFLLHYGIICIDRDIKPGDENGNQCGYFIADSLDDQIIENYAKYLIDEFKTVNQ